MLGLIAGFVKPNFHKNSRPPKMPLKKTKPYPTTNQKSPNAQSENCAAFVGDWSDGNQPAYPEYKG
jgi:hypothetical protein